MARPIAQSPAHTSAKIQTSTPKKQTIKLASGMPGFQPRLPHFREKNGKVQALFTASRIIRCFSRAHSRSFSVSRLSCCFFPFARPISSLIRPRTQCMSMGTRAQPARSTFPISLRISSAFRSSFRVRTGSGLTCFEASGRAEMWQPIRQTSPCRTMTQASLRLDRPARIALTSQPSSAIPASQRSSMKQS